MIEYLDRLSEDARRALLEAWRLSTVEAMPAAIDAEHLLYGVVSIKDEMVDAAIIIFTDVGRIQGNMRRALRQKGTASEYGAGEDSRLTDRAKEALALAAEEALVMGSTQIEPVHLLVALAMYLGRESVNATVKQLRERIALKLN